MYMFCPKCGSKLKEDALFCGECGEEIKQRESTNSTEKNTENIVEKKLEVEEASILCSEQLKELKERIEKLESNQNKLIKKISAAGKMLVLSETIELKEGEMEGINNEG